MMVEGFNPIRVHLKNKSLIPLFSFVKGIYGFQQECSGLT